MGGAVRIQGRETYDCGRRPLGVQLRSSSSSDILDMAAALMVASDAVSRFERRKMGEGRSNNEDASMLSGEGKDWREVRRQKTRPRVVGD